MIARLAEALADRCRIERELGGGGMSRVFLAREQGLNREVVIKVLSADIAAGVSLERFQREIQLAASLEQANIVPLLSAGNVDDVPYYTPSRTRWGCPPRCSSPSRASGERSALCMAVSITIFMNHETIS